MKASTKRRIIAAVSLSCILIAFMLVLGAVGRMELYGESIIDVAENLFVSALLTGMSFAGLYIAS